MLITPGPDMLQCNLCLCWCRCNFTGGSQNKTKTQEPAQAISLLTNVTFHNLPSLVQSNSLGDYVFSPFSEQNRVKTFLLTIVECKHLKILLCTTKKVLR